MLRLTPSKHLCLNIVFLIFLRYGHLNLVIFNDFEISQKDARLNKDNFKVTF